MSMSKFHTSLYNRRVPLVSYVVPCVFVNWTWHLCAETQLSHDILAAASQPTRSSVSAWVKTGTRDIGRCSWSMCIYNTRTTKQLYGQTRALQNTESSGDSSTSITGSCKLNSCILRTGDNLFLLLKVRAMYGKPGCVYRQQRSAGS